MSGIYNTLLSCLFSHKTTAQRKRTTRSRLGLEVLEDRAVPAALISLQSGVLRADGDGSFSTIKLSHVGSTTTLNGQSFSDASITRIELNAGSGGSQIRIDGTPNVPVSVKGSSGGDRICVHASSSPLLTIDDTANTSARSMTLDRDVSGNGRVAGLNATLTYSANQVKVLVVEGGKFGNTFTISNPAPLWYSYLITGDGNDTVNVNATAVGLYVQNYYGTDTTTVGTGTLNAVSGYVSISVRRHPVQRPRQLLTASDRGAADLGRHLLPRLALTTQVGQLAFLLVQLSPHRVEQFTARRHLLRAWRVRDQPLQRLAARILATVTPLALVSPCLHRQLVLRHAHQQPDQILRLIEVELAGRRSHEEARQHTLADVHGVEVPPQDGIGQSHADGDANGRIVAADQLLGGRAVAGADADEEVLEGWFGHGILLGFARQTGGETAICQVATEQ